MNIFKRKEKRVLQVITTIGPTSITGESPRKYVSTYTIKY